jgi:hypothetical protein
VLGSLATRSTSATVLRTAPLVASKLGASLTRSVDPTLGMPVVDRAQKAVSELEPGCSRDGDDSKGEGCASFWPSHMAVLPQLDGLQEAMRADRGHGPERGLGSLLRGWPRSLQIGVSIHLASRHANGNSVGEGDPQSLHHDAQMSFLGSSRWRAQMSDGAICPIAVAPS